jgi:catechol 2,3-dioxygenase-like lactoylglutathione lyase family enzyme
MLDHISFAVADLTKAVAFYDAVLLPLGYARIWTRRDAAGYAPSGEDEFFAIRKQLGPVSVPADKCHVAFRASTRDQVERFHASAMKLGAIDEGAPSLCPEYGEGYFAAFVRDLDGYRIEAVMHE